LKINLFFLKNEINKPSFNFKSGLLGVDVFCTLPRLSFKFGFEPVEPMNETRKTKLKSFFAKKLSIHQLLMILLVLKQNPNLISMLAINKNLKKNY